MNLLQRMLVKMALSSLGASRAIAPVPTLSPGEGYPGLPFTLPEESLNYPHAYELVPDIFACISLIQSTLASLPLRFYRGDDHVALGTDQVASAPWLWNTANDEDTGYDLMEQIIGALEIHGNAYVFLDFAGTNSVQGLWCIPSHTVQPIPGPKRRIDSYNLHIGGGQIVSIPREQILHFRLYHPTHSLVGLSPLGVARLQYETQRDSARWLRAFYQRGAVFSGFYSADTVLSDPDYERLKTEIRRRSQGPENAWQPVVLPRGLKFERQGLTNKDMEFVDTHALTTNDILRIFHIPPIMVGVKHGGGLSDAGAGTDLLMFWENCIKPRARKIEATINEKFLTLANFGEPLHCAFDFTRVHALQDAFIKQAEAFQSATGGPILTRAEAREMLQLPDLGDPALETLIMLPGATPPGSVPISVQTEVFPGAGNAKDGKSAAQDGSPSPGSHLQLTEGRRALRARADARLAQQERRLAGAVRRMYKQQERRAIRRLKARMEGAQAVKRNGNRVAGHAAIADDLFQLTAADRTTVLRSMRRVAATAAELALSDIGSSKSFDLNAPIVARNLSATADTLAQRVFDTTVAMLTGAILEGVNAGETLPELVARAREVFGERRAEVDQVATTEVAGVFNYATQAAWRDSGIVETKEWVSVNDDKTRDAHNEADGQVVALGEPFVVDGEELDFPGDPNASADNRINCRCSMVAGVAGDTGRSASKRSGAHVIDSRPLEELFSVDR